MLSERQQRRSVFGSRLPARSLLGERGATLAGRVTAIEPKPWTWSAERMTQTDTGQPTQAMTDVAKAPSTCRVPAET